MRHRIAALGLLLAGCSSPTPLPPHADQPKFDPIVFFAGRSEGAGALRVLLSGAKPIRVHSAGRRIAGNGVLLDQKVWEGTKAPRTRRWILHPRRPGRWTGSLSDASGPVAIGALGNTLSIHYVMKNGLVVDQTLRLLPDRKRAENRMTVRKWGVTIAHLDEAIRKLD